MKSADGTAIAVHRRGAGRPVVIVGGAFSTAADASALADALVERGFEAVTFDRRARGDSGDGPGTASDSTASDSGASGSNASDSGASVGDASDEASDADADLAALHRDVFGDQRRAPFQPEREAEDVTAVIEAVGGSAILLGHSSGALVALLAAARSAGAHGADSAAAGTGIVHLFLSEPPMRFGQDEPAADLPDRLQALVDEGRHGEAVVLFQREGVGLPEPMIEQIQASPLAAHLATLAQSTVYDARIAAATSTPDERMLAVVTPTTVLVGGDTFPLLERAAPMLVERMPSAALVRVPESRGHSLDPAATAAIIAERVPPR